MPPHSEPKRAMGRKLKAIMGMHRCTTEQVAAALADTANSGRGVSAMSVKRWANGSHDADAANQMALAALFRLRPDSFQWYVDEGDAIRAAAASYESAPIRQFLKSGKPMPVTELERTASVHG